ncbi:MAG: hypothetical protein ACFB02_18925 [Mastigocoleus sp.]
MKTKKRTTSLAKSKLSLLSLQTFQKNQHSSIWRFACTKSSNVGILSAIAATLLPTFTNAKFLDSSAALALQTQNNNQQLNTLIINDLLDSKRINKLSTSRIKPGLAWVDIEGILSEEQVSAKNNINSDNQCVSSLINWIQECSANIVTEDESQSQSEQILRIENGNENSVQKTGSTKLKGQKISPVSSSQESINSRLQRIIGTKNPENNPSLPTAQTGSEQSIKEQSSNSVLPALETSNIEGNSREDISPNSFTFGSDSQEQIQTRKDQNEDGISNSLPDSTSNYVGRNNLEEGVDLSKKKPAQQQSPPTQLSPQTQVPGETNNAQSKKTFKNEFNLDISPQGNPKVQADGRSTIKIRGEITNKNGQVINQDVMVTLTTSAGKFIGADQDKDRPGFQVLARGGEFIGTLRSGIKPQQVRIRGALDGFKKRTPAIRKEIGTLANPSFPQQTDTNVWNNFAHQKIEAYTQVEFITYLRPSLVTGIINFRVGARGTDYWGSRSEFLRPGEDGTEFDVDAAVFATGKVGEWLFTGAYNSERPLNQDCDGNNRLFGGIQFCEQQYPTYGDSSTFTSTAPSIDSIYAKIERSPNIPGAEPDYFMWGDYNTKEFSRESQLYTATSRQLHGFKGNYNIGKLQVTGLFANNIEGFQRDTFVPNGTSGNYFLSKRLIVPGSEIVYLESEEINRPGTVIEREQLYRGQDYDINYDRGTLLFRRPIQSTELSSAFGTTLVRKVVVTYQNDGGNDSELYGGRLQYNISSNIGKKTFVAASYLREDQGDQDYDIFGADFQISLGDRGKIIGEFARSTSNPITGADVEGNAYRIEANGKISNSFEGAAYYRSVEPSFNNNATFSFFPGQTRYGASLLARASKSTSFKVSYDVEENFGTAASNVVTFFDLFDPQPTAQAGETVNNELKTFRAGVFQKLGRADLGLEYVNRNRRDRVDDRFDANADQLVSTLKYPFTNKLSFQAQNELNLGSSDPLYPNRTTLALNWKAYPGVTFRLTHQFFDRSELIEGNSLTTLDTIVEHKFSEDTALNGSYSILSGLNGLQGQGAVGVNHGWAITPGLKMSLGYQYVFKNIFNATGTGEQFGQYYTVGQSASSLGLFSGSVYSVGFEYTDNPDLKASARFEFRDGDEGDNTVITLAGAGKISPALTALVRYQQAGEANVFLPSSSLSTNGAQFQELGDTGNLRIGLAYRNPRDDKFNGLLSYEWRQNFDSTVDNQLIGTTATGHVFSLEGIYAPNWRWEFYGKYAFRNGITYLDGDRFDGSVNLAQLRTTYRLGYRTDLAVEGRWIGQNSNSGTDYDELGWALETGYYLTPDLRVGLGYSFGSVEDRDFSGYRSRGGVYLNVSLKLNELFGGFGLQKPVPRQQQESEITQDKRTQTQSKLSGGETTESGIFGFPRLDKSQNTQNKKLIEGLQQDSEPEFPQQTSFSSDLSPNLLLNFGSVNFGSSNFGTDFKISAQSSQNDVKPVKLKLIDSFNKLLSKVKVVP